MSEEFDVYSIEYVLCFSYRICVEINFLTHLALQQSKQWPETDE